MHRNFSTRLPGIAILAGLTLVAPGIGILHAATSARDRIVGLYRLAKVVRRTAEGQETVTNADPVGRISYDKAGRVWVLLAPAGRKPAADQRNLSLDDYKEMTRGVMGYFGTYEVDEANQKLVIHIDAAANPALNGTTIERAYKLTDTTLTMTVPGNPATDNVFERLPEK